ncbi:MAG: phosphoribosyl-AMP cyclohydrolase [Fibrobacter sp.]|jgi:phosphoribosyl-AMP cyclohydrolase/phosphoribosyl-ATP pyrophosphohydrolase/phosphoribosyl-AMP cyclohydrolase|nr:phosphoribosyl-AMP cyclohydrolase [Fibrobacter sp.]
MSALDLFLIKLKWNSQGLIPVIVQDFEKLDVLMMAWMDKEALRRTLKQKEMVFWSRSRKEYWHKGATSGNVMSVVDFSLDCDGDALLFKVKMSGSQVACHTGVRSCFFQKM